MKLRGALIEEANLISEIAIQSKAYWDYSAEFIDACREYLTITEQYMKKNDVYVLEDKCEIIGFFSFERGEKNSLDFLYIVPKYIGKGYGKIMWENILQQAKKLEIYSFTIDSDPHAIGYYKKMGAIKIGETPSTVFEGRLLPLLRVDVS